MRLVQRVGMHLVLEAEAGMAAVAPAPEPRHRNVGGHDAVVELHRRPVRPELQRQRPVGPDDGRKLAEAFFAASRSGDVAALGALLAQDVSFHADGGGKRPAVARILRGSDEVVRSQAQLAKLASRHGSSLLLKYGFVNGLPGFVTREADGEIQTTALLVEEGRIKAIYVMRNPDKLERLKARLH